MRPSFLPRLVNGPLFDPVLYVRIMNEKRALMMDCGHFQGISNRELMAVEAICISHAHMDHFMGFDSVLRTILHRDAPLDLYGPEGMVEKTLAKLRAYTWNLTRDYGLEVRIHEVCPERVRSARTRADSGFVLLDEEILPRPDSRVAVLPRYSLSAVILDHGTIPCLAYVLRERFHVNIRKGALEKNGFLAGSWINELKEAVLAGRLDEKIRVKTLHGAAEATAGELGPELVIETRGHAVAFVTDIACTEENIARLEQEATGVDVLFIEAFYLDELEASAREKGHLTAGQAAMIARRLGTGRVFPMHISPRYHDRAIDFLAQMGLNPDGSWKDA